MPHADASLLPSSVKSKNDLWEHVYKQLASLLEGQRDWVRFFDIPIAESATPLTYKGLI